MKSIRECMMFIEMIPCTWTSFSNKFWKSLGKIQKSLTNIIAIYGYCDSLQGLMQNLGQEFLTQKDWVMKSQWDATNHADRFMINSFYGGLIFEHHHKTMVKI